jgi:hypothetical protein
MRPPAWVLDQIAKAIKDVGRTSCLREAIKDFGLDVFTSDASKNIKLIREQTGIWSANHLASRVG